GIYRAISNPLILPPKRVEKSETSKCSMGAMPLLPSSTFPQESLTVNPTGDTAPNPVTTTRLLLNLCSLAGCKLTKTFLPRQAKNLAGQRNQIRCGFRCSLSLVGQW